MSKKIYSLLLCAIFSCISLSGPGALASADSPAPSQQSETSSAAYAQEILDAAISKGRATSTIKAFPVNYSDSRENPSEPNIWFGQIIIWLLIIGGALGYWKMNAIAKTNLLTHPRTETELAGTKAWLAFFIFSLGIISPGLNLGNLSGSIYQTELKYPFVIDLLEWHYLKYSQLSLIGIYASFQIYVALQLKFVWKPSSVQLAKLALGAAPVVILINGTVLPKFFLSDFDASESANQFLLTLISVFIWIAYLSFSPRVKATYFPLSSTASTASNISLTKMDMTMPLVPSQSSAADFPHSSATDTSSKKQAWGESEAVNAKKQNETLSLSATTSLPTMPPDNFWEAALEEFDSLNRKKGVWARTYAQAQGDEAKAKADYLQIRAYELYQDHQAQASLQGV